MLITEAIPTPTFANHESFHLRYGWLKKGYNQAVKDKHIFTHNDATIKLGVGKNMVRAIKFWGIANKILTSSSTRDGTVTPTEIGNIIFDDNKGLDPYLEKSETLWLLHWLLYAPPCRIPVWWIIMNEFTATNINIDDITETITRRITNMPEWNTPSPKSIKKDIDVFIHTYTTRQDKLTIEDYLDCPFRQLHMIKHISKDTIRLVFGKKHGLTPMITAFICLDFVNRAGITSKNISVTRLATEAGSVGNILKINENELGQMLKEASELTDIIQIQNINGSQHLTFDDTAKTVSQKLLYQSYGKNKIDIPQYNKQLKMEAIAH
jgi:hypothetical protein